MALQLIIKKGFSFLLLFCWINLAMSSLPVPDSPVTMTVASVLATLVAIFCSLHMTALEPIKQSSGTLSLMEFFKSLSFSDSFFRMTQNRLSPL